jgi:uncharacterized membrane protein
MTVYSSASEDRVLPAIVYGLYLLGLVTILPIIIGFVVALANTGGAGPRMRTHFIFQSRSVWTALGWWVVGALLIVFGIPLSLVLVGVPMIVVGALIFSVGHIWFGLRCILGLLYLLKDEAYPRPRTWLV